MSVLAALLLPRLMSNESASCLRWDLTFQLFKGTWKEVSHPIATKNFEADDCCSTRTTLPLPISRNCGAVSGWTPKTTPTVAPSGIREVDDSKIPSLLTFLLSPEISRESSLTL